MEGDKFDKNQKWTIVLSIVAIIVSLGAIFISVLEYCNNRSELDNMQQQLELQEKQYNEFQKEKEINDKIAIATTTFRRASSEQDFDTAFKLFLEIHRIKPADSTGHDLFYYRATTCADKKLGEKLMEYAKQLKPK